MFTLIELKFPLQWISVCFLTPFLIKDQNESLHYKMISNPLGIVSAESRADISDFLKNDFRNLLTATRGSLPRTSYWCFTDLKEQRHERQTEQRAALFCILAFSNERVNPGINQESPEAVVTSMSLLYRVRDTNQSPIRGEEWESQPHKFMEDRRLTSQSSWYLGLSWSWPGFIGLLEHHSLDINYARITHTIRAMHSVSICQALNITENTQNGHQPSSPQPQGRRELKVIGPAYHSLLPYHSQKPHG